MYKQTYRWTDVHAHIHTQPMTLRIAWSIALGVLDLAGLLARTC